MTLGDYLNRLAKSLGVLSTLAVLLPLVSSFSGDWGSYLFPPLGDLTTIARLVCIFIVLAAICCGFIGVGAKSLKIWICLFTALVFISAVAYLLFCFKYVVRVDSPSSFVLVSIGSERSNFGKNTFTHEESPLQMLQARGLNDDQVKKIWTGESVDENRLRLFISYTFANLSWALLFALTTALEINSGPKQVSTP